MYQVSGRVIRGESLGRKLGFPTANLDRREYVRKKMKIKLGVYAGTAVIGKGVRIKDKQYQAGIVIGPIDEHGLPKIEAHLLGLKGNLYGKYLKIYLNKYLRPYRKFKNLTLLKKQIYLDLKKIKQSTR